MGDIRAWTLLLALLLTMAARPTEAACRAVCDPELDPGNPACKCKPCDTYALKCGFSGNGIVAAQMTATYNCQTQKLDCVVNVTKYACDQFGLHSTSPSSDASSLSALLAQLQDFSVEATRKAYSYACQLVHEITHALHRCDNTCTTEKDAYSAQAGCLAAAASAICAPPKNADFDSAWTPASTRCTSLRGNTYVPEGDACAAVKSELDQRNYDLNWLGRRCGGNKPACATEPNGPTYCFYKNSGNLRVNRDSYSGPMVCGQMESTYGAQIEAELKALGSI